MFGIELHEALLAFGLFALTTILSLVFIGVLLTLIPPTFFLDSQDRHLWGDRSPVVRWSGIILKNMLGVALIVFGTALSVPGIPGQGILTILIGLALLDVPGKRRLERRLVSAPRILRAVNRLRAKYGKPPLVLEETQSPDEATRHN